MSEEEIKYRNKIIRSYLIGRTWDNNPEFQLIRSVVSKEFPDKILCKNLEQYPYIIDYEWEVISGLSDTGKGDLIFTDDKNNFLIIECKYLEFNPLYGNKKTAGTRRTKKKKKIKEQIKKYMRSFKQIYKWNFEKTSIRGITITNKGWELYIFEDEKDKDED